jgi:hypothetical protein
MQYSVAEGLPPDALSQAVLRQPALAKILHKAELYDQLEKKQAVKAKPATQDKPVTRIRQPAQLPSVTRTRCPWPSG